MVFAGLPGRIATKQSKAESYISLRMIDQKVTEWGNVLNERFVCVLECNCQAITYATYFTPLKMQRIDF